VVKSLMDRLSLFVSLALFVLPSVFCLANGSFSISVFLRFGSCSVPCVSHRFVSGRRFLLVNSFHSGSKDLFCLTSVSGTVNIGDSGSGLTE
jgi:hypothetical protein